MFGISGVALGAILKAKGKSYADLAKVGVIFALFVAVLAFLVTLIPGLNDFAQFILAETGVIGAFLNEHILSRWAVGTFTFSIITAIVSAVVGMLSLLIGGAIIDIAEAITD